MTAMEADQRRKRIAVRLYEGTPGQPRRSFAHIEQASELARSRLHGHHSAAILDRLLASIWSTAETTASKVSKVDAWRAL